MSGGSAVAALVALASSVAYAESRDNVVLRWNQAALNSIRASRASPPVAARALAIAHTCMFDAWAAYDQVAAGTKLGGNLRRPPDERTQANKEKAVSFAAYRALVDLFPSQRMMKLDPLMVELGFDSADTSGDIATPSGIGNSVCKAVLEFRHRDGSNQLGEMHDGAYSDYTNFSPANTAEVLRVPSRWQPLLVNGAPQRWLLPQWALVIPFAMATPAQFRDLTVSEGPYMHPSAAFWKQALDVADLSAKLGDREKVIAEYWADGADSFTPPGHWNVFAQTMSRRRGDSLDRDVQFFFILNNALLDASIACWDVKRCTDSVRPITVVRMLMPTREIRAWAGPGLGIRTILGRDFRSYIPTPPFGSYVSGHSTFSAAAAEILKRFTGSDEFGDSFTASPGSSLIEPGLTPSKPVTLSWRTFTEAADEAGMSRRYGGIHYEKDDIVGQALGRRVATEVWKLSITYVQGLAP
jgi:hypothetical protein